MDTSASLQSAEDAHIGAAPPLPALPAAPASPPAPAPPLAPTPAVPAEPPVAPEPAAPPDAPACPPLPPAAGPLVESELLQAAIARSPATASPDTIPSFMTEAYVEIRRGLPSANHDGPARLRRFRFRRWTHRRRGIGPGACRTQPALAFSRRFTVCSVDGKSAPGDGRDAWTLPLESHGARRRRATSAEALPQGPGRHHQPRRPRMRVGRSQELQARVPR